MTSYFTGASSSASPASASGATSSRFSLASSAVSSPPPSLYSSSQNPSSSTISNVPNPNRRESNRSSVIQPSSLQQQLFGGGGGGGAAPASGGGGGGTGGPVNILERPLNKTKGAEVGMGAWSFLLAEVVAYSQSRVDSVHDLEARLSSLGYEAGQRILTLLLLRNTQTAGGKDPRREHRLIPILQFVHTQVYKYCFGKPADGLERSVEEENEYMITLNQPPLTQHISVPKDMSQLSCEAFTAGIVEGVLDGLDVPARVTAHTVGTDQYPQRTVILIKLDQKVMDREEALGK
ncbi:hypothetical protein CI109_100240 [Kwoniella shandongensis]|uniref:Trafficking protein particle complex subunit n=1 Tax=Kwoniella shandongensis TaxID=1734106 RepID=A0A5M6BTM7_9TREE|nr:uncharacterized protein CI109_006224 [Kwoniella shandongensis]KAA5525420.1 hypothetical protein CI109_006224 [Kwoniella shandongensis]